MKQLLAGIIIGLAYNLLFHLFKHFFPALFPDSVWWYTGVFIGIIGGSLLFKL